jgi:hypothetical protein
LFVIYSILNKITPEKFKKLSKELLSVGLDSAAILKGVILLIFDKALEEPKYSSMYAQLCRIISEEAPNFETNRDSAAVGHLNKVSYGLVFGFGSNGCLFFVRLFVVYC